MAKRRQAAEEVEPTEPATKVVVKLVGSGLPPMEFAGDLSNEQAEEAFRKANGIISTVRTFEFSRSSAE